jgi:hypothetical protein
MIFLSVLQRIVFGDNTVHPDFKGGSFKKLGVSLMHSAMEILETPNNKPLAKLYQIKSILFYAC